MLHLKIHPWFGDPRSEMTVVHHRSAGSCVRLLRRGKAVACVAFLLLWLLGLSDAQASPSNPPKPAAANAPPLEGKDRKTPADNPAVALDTNASVDDPAMADTFHHSDSKLAGSRPEPVKK